MIGLWPHRQAGRDMVMDQETEWLYQLLAEVQLEKFYLRVRDGLNITRIEHFTYVKESDLEQIGISKPGKPDRLLWSPMLGGSQYISVLSGREDSPQWLMQDKDALSSVYPQICVCLLNLPVQPLDLQRWWSKGTVHLKKIKFSQYFFTLMSMEISPSNIFGALQQNSIAAFSITSEQALNHLKTLSTGLNQVSRNPKIPNWFSKILFTLFF